MARKRNKRLRANKKRKTVRMPKAVMCQDGADYIRCVLDPFAGPAKVPDGACDSVLIEYNLEVTGTPLSSGVLGFACIPGLPCSLAGLYGNFNGPDRSGATVNVSVPALADTVLFPFPDFSFSSPYVSGTVAAYNGTTNIRSARCVSYKMDVLPIGIVTQQGGVAATGRVPFRYSQLWPMLDNGISFAGVTYAGHVTEPVWIGSTVTVNSFQNLSAFPKTKIITGTESCSMVGIPKDNAFTPVAVINADAFGNVSMDSYPLCGGFTTNATSATAPETTGGAAINIGSAMAMVPAASGTDVGLLGNFWFSNDTDSLMWLGSGLSTTTSYLCRVKVCMEVCVSHNTSSYRPFITPAAEPDLRSIEAVRKVMTDLPPSLPKPGSSGTWWSALTEAATGVSDIVKDLGIPVVSGAAGIFSKVFTKLAG